MTKEIKEISDEAIRIMKDYPYVTIMAAIKKAEEVIKDVTKARV